ncbi:MAG TPA: hypothetical protein VFC46_07715 [Humisphaera sp.]|nr:hypothetical protein [Humisphaera sp.]
MLIYKQRAWLRNQVYTDLEIRLLHNMTQNEAAETWVFAQFDLLLSSLLNGGQIIDTGETRPHDLPEILRQRRYILTEAGRALVAMFSVNELDSLPEKPI